MFPLVAYDFNRGCVQFRPVGFSQTDALLYRSGLRRTIPVPITFYEFTVGDNEMVFPRTFFERFRRNPDRFKFGAEMRMHVWQIEALGGYVVRFVAARLCGRDPCSECSERLESFTRIKQQLIERRDSIQRAIDAIAPAFEDGDGAIKWRVVQFLL